MKYLDLLDIDKQKIITAQKVKMHYAIIIKTQMRIYLFLAKLAKTISTEKLFDVKIFMDEKTVSVNNYFYNSCDKFIKHYEANIKQIENECESDLNIQHTKNIFYPEDEKFISDIRLQLSNKTSTKVLDNKQSLTSTDSSSIIKMDLQNEKPQQAEVNPKLKQIFSIFLKPVEQASNIKSPFIVIPKQKIHSDALLAHFANDTDFIALTDRIHINRTEINNAIKDNNQYYTADFVNLLLHECSKDLSLVIYSALPVNMLHGNYADIQAQQKDFAFIPLNVAWDKRDLEHKNHWAGLIVDKAHQQIFYLDPARKETPLQVQELRQHLGYKNLIIENPIDHQEAEKKEGWIRHCGAYLFEIFREMIKAIKEDKILHSLDAEEGVEFMKKILSTIPCGAAENIRNIREAHIREAEANLAKFMAIQKGDNEQKEHGSDEIRTQKSRRPGFC